MQLGLLRQAQVATDRSHGSTGWAQWPFEVRVRQSPTHERHTYRGFRRRQAHVQDVERQRRMVPGVVMSVRQGCVVVVKLEGQRVVVMMPLARLVHQRVVDLQRQGVGLSRHEGHRRQQLQREQNQDEPPTEHGEILAAREHPTR